MNKGEDMAVDKTANINNILKEAHWVYHKSLVNEKITHDYLDALEEALPDVEQSKHIINKIRETINNSRCVRRMIGVLKKTIQDTSVDKNHLIVELAKEKRKRNRDRFFFFIIVAIAFTVCGIAHL